jgi:signal transduction histidine kinase
VYRRLIDSSIPAGRSGGSTGRLFDLPRRVALGFAAAVLCLVATVGITTRLEVVRDEQARLVHRTTETLLALEALESSYRVTVATLDASLRGAPALPPDAVPRALDRLAPALERASRLMIDEPEQQARVAALASPLLSLAGRAREALEAQARGDGAIALAFLEELAPARLTALEAGFSALEQAEALLLERRYAAWRRASMTGAVAFSLATAVLLLLILLAARLVRAEMRVRDRLSAERAEMLALQQQLMAVVSHDLRNPLAAMMSAATLIARCETVDDAHRDDARRVVSNARRMERLIRDLLDFSRLRAGQALPIRPDQADLVDVCRRAISDLGREAEGRVTVEGRGEVSGPWERDRLEQVVTNLVSNALKYGPDRPVRVVVDGAEAEVRLSVSDEGGGIPPALQQAIFEPFRRAVAGDAQEGRSAGLGLYIVRRIAEAHGGGVAVRSAPGQGTTFTVTLPRQRVPAAAPAAAGG